MAINKYNLTLLAYFFSQTCTSEPLDVDNLMALDLEELMTITVVSKHAELVENAPGIVSISSYEDFEYYGDRDLRDVLNRMTNTEIVSGESLSSNFSVRGAKTKGLDNAILPMINGIPIRNTGIGNISSDLTLVLPLMNVEQVEMVRGPGSVLYGPNAFTSMVNIKTKKPTKTGISSAVSLGSFSRNQSTVAPTYRNSEYWVSASVTTVNSTGSEVSEILDKEQTSGHWVIDDYSGYGMWLTMGNKNVSFTGLKTKVQTNAIDNIRFIYPISKKYFGRDLLNVSYDYGITKSWNLTSLYTYNQSFHDGTQFGAPGVFRVNTSHLAEITLTGSLTDQLFLTLGTAYEDNTAEIPSGPEIEVFESWWAEAYAELNYKITDSTRIIVGGQINKAGELDEDFVPRAGLVYNFENGWGAKFLYGEAYLFPPELSSERLAQPAETSKNYDVQFFYNSKQFDAVLNFYSTEHAFLSNPPPGSGDQPPRPGDQLPNPDDPPPGPVIDEDAAPLEGKKDFYKGIELEFDLKLNNHLMVETNISYQTNESGTGKENKTLVPNLMSSIGFKYAVTPNIKWSILDNYRGAAFNDEKKGEVLNREAKSYHLLKMNLNMNLSRMLHIENVEELTLSILFDNILAVEAYYPEPEEGNINVPHNIGRGVYATLVFKY